VDVHVDGQSWVAAVAEGGPSRVDWPLPLSPGRHHLSLHKRQEAAAGTFAFGGIAIAPGAQAWRPAAPRYALSMEFYGDSITAGACDEDGPSDQWEDRRTHNGERCYAAFTGEAFGADWRNISVSGIGIVTGWIPVVAGQTWDKLYPRADSPAADLSLWVPDVVLVNLGDNDADYPKAHALPFPDGFDARYTQLIQAIRRAYPRAEVVMLLGGMESGSHSAPLNAEWGRAVARLESADPRMHHFLFTHWTPSHPRVSDHRILADELISWLRRQDFMARYAR
jgi:lysophospholipase L1-like esterase